jgi:hypothetical protein
MKAKRARENPPGSFIMIGIKPSSIHFFQNQTANLAFRGGEKKKRENEEGHGEENADYGNNEKPDKP